jgi:phage baseplate assembly protein gpV
VTKSTSLKWARYVEGTGVNKCKEGTVGKRKRKNLLVRPRRGREGVNWINVNQVRTGGGKAI